MHGDDKIEPVQWLQHFLKRSPLDFTYMEHVDSYPNNAAAPRELPAENMMNTCHLCDAHSSSQHPFPSSKQQFRKNLSRSTSVAGNQCGSPLQSFYD